MGQKHIAPKHKNEGFKVSFPVYMRMCTVYNCFSEQKIMTVIYFHHDLQKTKMPFSVTMD